MLETLFFFFPSVYSCSDSEFKLKLKDGGMPVQSRVPVFEVGLHINMMNEGKHVYSEPSIKCQIFLLRNM